MEYKKTLYKFQFSFQASHLAKVIPELAQLRERQDLQHRVLLEYEHTIKALWFKA